LKPGRISGGFQTRNINNSTFSVGGSFITVSIGADRFEEGLLIIKKILKEKLYAPDKTIIREFTWSNTRYNYSFRLDEAWEFVNSNNSIG